jgi:hypothetical protein
MLFSPQFYSCIIVDLYLSIFFSSKLLIVLRTWAFSFLSSGKLDESVVPQTVFVYTGIVLDNLLHRPTHIARRLEVNADPQAGPNDEWQKAQPLCISTLSNPIPIQHRRFPASPVL